MCEGAYEQERGVNWKEVGTHFPSRVAQEFGVQAMKSELGHGHDGGTQAGIWCLKKRKG